MNNNNNKTPDNNGTSTPNQPTPQSPDQITDQPTVAQQQPIQPAPQPIQPPQQPIPSPQPIQQPPQPIQTQPYTETIVDTSNSNNQNPKKKTAIIIGCSIGGLAVIALIVGLIVILLKHGEKTVSCTTDTTDMGIPVKAEIDIKVRDGEISSGDMTVNVDLKSMSDEYKDYESEMVDEMTEDFKDRCHDHCTFDRKYTEGDNVKYTLQYDKDGVDEIITTYGTNNMSAQEIADKVQETFENYETTCRQH